MSDEKMVSTAAPDPIAGTLAFFASCIRCGADWDQSCQDAYDRAFAALAALKQSPEAEGAGELPKLFVAQGTVEFYIMADGEAQLTKSQAAEVIRRVEAYDTLAAENARMRSNLEKVKRLALEAIKSDCQCGADDGSQSVDECWWHEVLRHANALTTPTSPWLTEKLRETALMAAEEGIRYADIHKPTPYDTKSVSEHAASVVDGLKLGEG